MSTGFPPNVLYPLAIDTDRTLYKVYNTTETIITANNDAWSEEILIKAQPAGALEIWADNGFANISGELLYYDSVDKDVNGKIYRLKRCLRNLGGSHTQYNPAGTWIRSFVVAEHHEQISTAIQLVEGFVGENFSPISATLDWRIRHLAAEPFVADDCPDVVFNFNIIQSDPVTGTIANYAVQVNGSIGGLDIQFGDGTSTTTPQGTHTYAPNANIDPVVVVTNDGCQVVQTPNVRDEVSAPVVPPPTQPFAVPIPIPFPLPPLIFPSVPIPSVDLFLPPIQFPCIDLSPLSFLTPNINIPSINISFPLTPISLIVPSTIALTPIPIPPISLVSPTFAPIQFGPVPTIPFGPVPTIPFGPVPTIPFGPAPSWSPIPFGPVPCMSLCTPPVLSVNWGTPPTISVAITCPSTSPMAAGARFRMDDKDYGYGDDEVEIQYDMVGFPTEIKVVPPKIPPIDVRHTIPNVIDVRAPKFDEIRIKGPDVPLPNEIRLVAPNKDDMIYVISFEIPKVKFDTEVFRDLSIPVTFPTELPRIMIDATGIPNSIQVVGVPSVLSVVGMPGFIDVRVPSDMRIPLFLDGPPLSAEVKVKIDIQRLLGESDEVNCVAIVPCRK